MDRLRAFKGGVDSCRVSANPEVSSPKSEPDDKRRHQQTSHRIAYLNADGFAPGVGGEDVDDRCI